MTINIHGKQYKMVAERIMEAHKDHGNKITILTKIVNKDWLTAGVIVMKATIIIEVKDEQYSQYTGHAYEQLGSSQINQTSALENCETSAIGRALACAGYVGSEFASADELTNALNQQQSTPKETTSSPQQYASHKKGDLLGQWDSYDDNVNFGKHRNLAWTDVPEDYLRWIVEKATKVPEGAKEMASGMLDIKEVTPVTQPTTVTPSTTKTAQTNSNPIKGVKKESSNNAQKAIDRIVDKYAGEISDEQSDLPF